VSVVAREGQKTTSQPFGHYVKRLWEPDPRAQGGLNARRGGLYQAFVPDPLAGRSFQLDEDVHLTLHQATKLLERLQHAPTRIATLGAIAQNLLRSESVASSRIEGVLISHKRLARAAHQGPGKRRIDNRAAEVLGNVEAMKQAIELGAEARPIEVPDLLEIHRLLLRFTEDREIAGVVRTAQNWIGGSDYNPIAAAFVPPPPEHVPDLLDDLCRFAARDDLPPIVQAAIVHAQFETIHPFADGNGRTGRALVYSVLRRRGEVSTYIPPISLVLVHTPKHYIGGLTAYREGDVSEWCDAFAGAVARAAEEAEHLAAAIEALEEKWLERAGALRKDSAARVLIGALPEQPVIDVASAQRLTDRSGEAASGALTRLEEAGILRRLNERKWGRLWECDELLDLVEEFEESVRRSFPGS
jgi:Fic family protein